MQKCITTMPGNLFCNSDVSSTKGEENSIENQKSWESKPWITSLDLVTLCKGTCINDVRFLGGEGGSKMTPKNRTLEGKNRTLGGRGGQKSSKIVGHHLCTFPNSVAVFAETKMVTKSRCTVYLNFKFVNEYHSHNRIFLCM